MNKRNRGEKHLTIAQDVHPRLVLDSRPALLLLSPVL